MMNEVESSKERSVKKMVIIVAKLVGDPSAYKGRSNHEVEQEILEAIGAVPYVARVMKANVLDVDLRFVWHLLAGCKGGESRAKILVALRARPYNRHQLAGILDLDYKTIKHHLKILLENGLAVKLGSTGYGAPYTLSDFMDANFNYFKEIWEKTETDRII